MAYVRITACALVLAFALLMRTAYATSTSTYTRYRAVSGTAHVTHVRILTRCIDGEDSATHLHLKDYTHTHAVYVCKRNGY